ncbi:MAG: response regulator [Verrucomicrobiota bacterium]
MEFLGDQEWIEILVVDDDEDFTGALRTSLEARGGFRVLCEHNSSRALSDCLNCHPDIVLLDALMPGLDGDDVYRQIKGHDRLKEIPVILISALYPMERRRQGELMRTEHGHPILGKPVSTDELIEVICSELLKGSSGGEPSSSSEGPLNH